MRNSYLILDEYVSIFIVNGTNTAKVNFYFYDILLEVHFPPSLLHLEIIHCLNGSERLHNG